MDTQARQFIGYVRAVMAVPTVWAMESDYLHSLSANILNGFESKEPFSLQDFGIPQQSMVSGSIMVPSDTGSDIEIGVQKMHGVLTRFGGPCGEKGTADIAEAILKKDRNPNVKAHVLDISSPGAEAIGLDSLWQVIRYQVKKPVVAYVAEVALSGAYYIASAADEIYLSGKAAKVGSIGMVLNYIDNTRYLKNAGLEKISVSATRSTNKRAVNFSQPSEEDFQAIRKTILNPLNEVFLQSVKIGRPKASKESLTGWTYFGQAGINNGLADGFSTFDNSVIRAAELGTMKSKP